MSTSDSDVWVGTEDGVLNRLDRATGRFTRFRPAYADGGCYPIHAVFEDHTGALWIGSNGGGLSRLDRATGRLTSYRNDPADPHSLSHNYVNSIYEDPSGTLWVGTFGGGLNRFDRASERFTSYRHDPADARSLSNDLITVMYADHTGTLWVGTAAGLNRFDPATESFSHITERDGLQSNLVQGLTEADGKLWISSQRGLSTARPTDDDHSQLWRRRWAAGGWVHARHAHTWRRWAGCRRRLRRRRRLRPVHGKRRLGHPTDRAHSRSTSTTSPVTIGGASPLKQALNESDALVLPAGSRNLSLEIAALDYRAPDLQRYRYRLEGVDTQWNEGGAARRFVSYHDLGPGTYVLHASGTNRVGLWNENGRTLTITILPYWWETLWFRVVLATLGGLIVVGLVQYRVANLQTRQRQLEQQVASRTEDLVKQAHELEQTNAQLATTSAQFRQAAAEARQSRDEFETLLLISNEIVSMHDIDALLNVLLEHLARVIAYDSAYIATLDGNTLTIRAFRTRVRLARHARPNHRRRPCAGDPAPRGHRAADPGRRSASG